MKVDSLAKGGELENLMSSLQQITSSLNIVKRQQRYIKMRTDRQYKTIESTYSTTLWWSFFESAVIICASLVQVIAVRHLFLSGSKTFRV